MSKPFFITTPIYYVNSTPTIGHASTQIAADARARFERMRGRRVYFLTGTDENAIKVARVAQAQGRDPKEFCDELSQTFREVWDALNISYDDYIRTTEPRHIHVARQIIQKLWDGGHLTLGSYSGWYSVPDETFFAPDKVVERDGAHYIAAPTEDQTKAPLEWVEEPTHFFNLSKFAPTLLDYYAEHPQTLRPEARRNETLAYIERGLEDTSVSREMNWGISFPPNVPEHEGQVIYVWFEALMNYFSAPGYLSDDPARRAFFEECWPPDLQLMSKDIFTRFHATLWPALLSALELPYPQELFAHGFWTVNGRKMSKRDPETIIEPIPFTNRIAELAGCDFGTAVDALRFYSLREVTFGSDGDFSREGCLTRYNTELANGLGNLVNRAISMLKQYFGSVVPEGETNLGLRVACEAAHERVTNAYATLDFTGALGAVQEVVSLGNRVIEEQKPWAKIKVGEREAVAGLLRELLAVCQWCGHVLAPVMPHSTAKLRNLLGLESATSNAASALTWDNAIAWDLLPAGHQCQPPQPLYPRIAKIEDINIMEKPIPETEAPVITTEAPLSEPPTSAAPAPTTVEDVAAANNAPVAAVMAAQPEAEPLELIEYADFAKVQLRTGKVLEAERIPKADKLLRLQVDIGTETRQILAGIAQQFTPEEMVGKTIVVVVNLAPRKLRGFESQGMLLAASAPENDAPSGLVMIDADVPPGSIVR